MMGRTWAARLGASLNTCHILGLVWKASCQRKDNSDRTAWTSTFNVCSFQKPPKWSPLKLRYVGWVEDQDPLWVSRVSPETSRIGPEHVPAYP